MNQVDAPVVTTYRSPPRPPLTVRVGVVGHRPNRLDGGRLNELAATMAAILTTIKDETHAVGRQFTDLYDSASPIMRAISPLAEGTDRIFAEQALALGFELCAVLPFPQCEFEKDFEPGEALEANSRDRFRGLLAKATTRFELDGTRAESEEAYGEGGLVVLNQSDLLIVVWDGERQGKRGGTEDTFSEARRRGLTVVWIDAKEPENWQLLDAATELPRGAVGARVVPNRLGTSAALAEQVREILEIPKLAEEPRSEMHHKDESRDAKHGHHDKTEPHDKRVDAGLGLKLFYAEHRPPFALAIFWKIFVRLIGDGKIPNVRFVLDDFENAVREDWPEDHSKPIGQIVDRLRPFYAWPDGLAVLYADRYRSAFASNYLTAAFAVFLALLPVALGPHLGERVEITCIWLELAAIFLILHRVWRGRRNQWHERWIDYRLAAELVRHLRMVAPLGGRRLLPQIPAHRVTYGQPAATWMAWYVRAVERWLGLPTAVINASYLDEYLKQLEHLVIGQIRYHQTTLRRCHNMETRLHWGGVALLGVTVLACLAHLGVGIRPDGDRLHVLSPVLTFLCGFLPALGAALAAISNQGEFRSLTKQSRAMRAHLRNRLPEIKELRELIRNTPDQSACQFSTKAEKLGRTASDLLVNEVLDWRSVVLDQPLRTPA
jgi:hypothetical protein